MDNREIVIYFLRAFAPSLPDVRFTKSLFILFYIYTRTREDSKLKSRINKPLPNLKEVRKSLSDLLSEDLVRWFGQVPLHPEQNRTGIFDGKLANVDLVLVTKKWVRFLARGGSV